MGAKEKREKERLVAIDQRKKEVVEAAKVIFAEKSIEKTTMQDIALKAEVGVASVYRYYSAKADLVMGVALDYLQNDFMYENLSNHSYVGTGIQQASQIIDQIISKMCQNPNMLVFMEQLDAFVISLKNDKEQMEVYEKVKNQQIPILTRALRMGKADGSIRGDIQEEEIGMTCLEIFMTIAQRQIIREQLLKIQSGYTSSLDIYKEMIIKYLQAA